MWKWLMSGVSLLGMVVLVAARYPQSASLAVPPAPASSQTVFVHLFEWTWDDVAEECEQYLGPMGFQGVQVSPAQEHVVLPQQGYPWWQRYQPVSYRLESRSGSRQAFAAMVQRCRQAGVRVYADAVINHMAGIDGGTGSGGTAFTKYSYPGLYQAEDFNACRRPISDYGNAENVTQCELVGLADLDTASAHVQAQIVAYLQDLVSLGVGGFRIDAAKHMRSQEIGTILAQLQQQVGPGLYIYQEVIDPGTEAIKKQSYYSYGNVIEFEYGRLVSEAFLAQEGRQLADLVSLGEAWGLAPSSQAVVFIDNHDKQRGHGGGGNYLTHQQRPLYLLANVFMLAHPYGTPQVMSSFPFSDSDQGPPADAAGQTRRVHQGSSDTCFQAWVCEHRWTAIGQMVGFRNATAAFPALTDWWSNGHNQIAFGRGNRGFVVINREAAPLRRTFTTQLPAGRYCNVIQGGLAPSGRSCQGQAEVITVNAAGQFTAAVASLDAIAIHVEARLPD
ncbi:MAG: alpha-amylase family protein [Cyanobacteria bacterium Co-bin13]|nr:alpha-amylase family protein [Cyanobacteria bacterium Co-bin13]